MPITSAGKMDTYVVSNLSGPKVPSTATVTMDCGKSTLSGPTVPTTYVGRMVTYAHSNLSSPTVLNIFTEMPESSIEYN